MIFLFLILIVFFVLYLISVYLLYVVKEVVMVLLKFTLLRALFSKRNKLNNPGKFAIITGASSGIGKAFAVQLAKEGLNLFLIDINSIAMGELASTLEYNYKVEVKTFVADCTKVGYIDDLKLELGQLSSVICLVNNVGISYKYPDEFASSANILPEFIEKMTTCNCITPIAITRLVLPKLLENGKNTNSFIINISSVSGVIPMPYMAAYGATKAFICNFFSAIKLKLRKKGIIIQTFIPSVVATNMSRIIQPSLFVPSPDRYVSSALDMLGVSDDCSGYMPHEFRRLLYNLLPKYLLNKLTSKVLLNERNKEMDKGFL